MVLKSKNTGFFEVLKLRDAGDDDDDATAAERQALRRDAEVFAVYVQELADTLYFLLPSRATLRITETDTPFDIPLSARRLGSKTLTREDLISSR